MSQAQNGILWIGILVVLVFLFTDQNFRNQIFGRASTTSATGVTTTAATTSTSSSSVPYSGTTILNTLTGQNTNLA